MSGVAGLFLCRSVGFISDRVSVSAAHRFQYFCHLQAESSNSDKPVYLSGLSEVRAVPVFLEHSGWRDVAQSLRGSFLFFFFEK